MALFIAPTAEEVRKASGLDADQVDENFVTDDFDALVQQAINDAVARVESKMRGAVRPYPLPLSDSVLTVGLADYTSEQRTEWWEGIQANAVQSAKYFALAAVFRRSGQMVEGYKEKADDYEKLGKDLLNGDPDDGEDVGIIGQLAAVRAQQGSEPDADTFSTTFRRVDSYSRCRGEYVCEDYCP